ncbi:putative ammonium transporter 1 [Diadema antillarum]|uniref:putative ammonium transporter 1 n=1 Tax=Diadema antillarum TaxID=105358 RepID=UPI003A847DDC
MADGVPNWNKTAEDVKLLTENVDTFFLTVFGSIVFFMHCGFAYLEAGSIRTKNFTNTVMKNLMDSGIGVLVYWAVGFAFAFGKGNPFIGLSYFFFDNLSAQEYAFFYFEFTFAAACTTTISGALAERLAFLPYILYSAAMTGFIYPVISHWVWTEEGWLNSGPGISGVTMQDFAGSGVVHMAGGTVGLVGAVLLGPRLGRFDEQGRPRQIVQPTIPYIALGTFILVFGFMAFNGGSALTLSKRGDNVVVAHSIICTVVSVGASSTTTMAVVRLFGSTKQWNFTLVCNGALAGAVSICAGCDVIPTWSALIIGCIASLTYLAWSWLVLKLRIDDPVDAVAVHLGAGTWGIIAAPLFSKTKGVFFNFNRFGFTVICA